MIRFHFILELDLSTKYCSLDDCFDFIDEPLYGFRTLVRTEKFCMGNDLNCLQASSSKIGIQSRQTEGFVSEAPAACLLICFSGSVSSPKIQF